MPKEPVNCHPSVWKRLVAISDKRRKAKSDYEDLRKHRKTIEEDLAGKGKTPSAERTRLCVEHWDTIQAIAYERARMDTLADLFEQTIEKGKQGELFEDNSDLDADPLEDDEDAPLYSGDDDGERKKPGSKRRPEAPTAPLWRADTPTANLSISAKSLTALRDAGLMTLGDLARFKAENYGNSRLTKLGVEGKDELAIEAALRDLPPASSAPPAASAADAAKAPSPPEPAAAEEPKPRGRKKQKAS